jgi:hypothetical protein
MNHECLKLCFVLGFQAKHPIKRNHLEGQLVTGRMRGMLVDWLVEVHQQFHLLAETLYLTVAIIDRYLQVDLQIFQSRCSSVYELLFYSVYVSVRI